MSLGGDAPMLAELKKISKILLLANSSIIEKELSKVANSDIRKKMWVLLDGGRMPKDIAQEVGVSLMAVSRFLDGASAADLVAYSPREPPRRILDYIPPSWVDLVLGEAPQESQKATAQKNGVNRKNPEKPLTTQTNLSASFDVEGEKK